MFQFDENITNIILAVISLVSLIYTKKLDVDSKEASKKRDAESLAFAKEKELREAIWDKKEELDRIKSMIMISVLHSNTALLKYAVEEDDKVPLEKEALGLESRYNAVLEDLRRLKERYAMLLEVSAGISDTRTPNSDQK